MTWESYWAWVWFAVEAHTAVICASAPALKTFFKHTFEVPALPVSGHKKSYSDIESSGPWLEKDLSYPSPTYAKFPSNSIDMTGANEKKGKRLQKKNWEPQEGAFF